MELVYLWVKNYKNIVEQEFNFSPRFRCEYDEKENKLDIVDKEETGEFYPKNFFGSNIQITGIIGENGAGKSSVFEFLINEITEQKNYICIFYDKEKKKLGLNTNNQDIYKKNQKQGYFRIRYLRKYFGYINISPHENTIKHKEIRDYFGMVPDKFNVTKFNNFLNKEKKDLNDSKDIKFEFLLKQIEKFIFMKYPDSYIDSSGEKAIIYYLGCIQSLLNTQSSLIIFIDEIELFLHPMWQKRVIKIFIESLQNKITKNIHIVIASHSPFILSDLPKENIIFLEKGKQVYPFEDGKQTFGANIHTLLSHGFFMKDGLMGEFAKSKIDDVINYLNNKETEIENDQDAQNIINIIGEPIIKRELQKMLDSKRLSKVDKIDKIEKDIKELQKKLEEYKNANE